MKDLSEKRKAFQEKIKVKKLVAFGVYMFTIEPTTVVSVALSAVVLLLGDQFIPGFAEYGVVAYVTEYLTPHLVP